MSMHYLTLGNYINVELFMLLGLSLLLLLLLWGKRTAIAHSAITTPKVNDLYEIKNTVSPMLGTSPGRFLARSMQ